MTDLGAGEAATQVAVGKAATGARRKCRNIDTAGGWIAGGARSAGTGACAWNIQRSGEHMTWEWGRDDAQLISNSHE